MSLTWSTQECSQGSSSGISRAGSIPLSFLASGSHPIQHITYLFLPLLPLSHCLLL